MGPADAGASTAAKAAGPELPSVPPPARLRR